MWKLWRKEKRAAAESSATAVESSTAAAESAGGAVDTTDASHFSDYRSAHSIFNDPIRNRFSS